LKREKKQIPRLPPCGIARDDNGGDELNSIEDVLAFALLTKPCHPESRDAGEGSAAGKGDRIQKTGDRIAITSLSGRTIHIRPKPRPKEAVQHSSLTTPLPFTTNPTLSSRIPDRVRDLLFLSWGGASAPRTELLLGPTSNKARLILSSDF